MTRCYPSEPEFGENGRAERVVWEALRDQLPDDAALFHSVNLLDREREQEIDLLVAWPGVGLAAIEVKGGYVTRDADGWHQGSGAQRHDIDPVAQAQDGRHILTRFLSARGADASGARAARRDRLSSRASDRPARRPWPPHHGGGRGPLRWAPRAWARASTAPGPRRR